MLSDDLMKETAKRGEMLTERMKLIDDLKLVESEFFTDAHTLGQLLEVLDDLGFLTETTIVRHRYVDEYIALSTRALQTNLASMPSDRITIENRFLKKHFQQMRQHLDHQRGIITTITTIQSQVNQLNATYNQYIHQLSSTFPSPLPALPSPINNNNNNNNNGDNDSDKVDNDGQHKTNKRSRKSSSVVVDKSNQRSHKKSKINVKPKIQKTKQKLKHLKTNADDDNDYDYDDDEQSTICICCEKPIVGNILKRNSIFCDHHSCNNETHPECIEHLKHNRPSPSSSSSSPMFQLGMMVLRATNNHQIKNVTTTTTRNAGLDVTQKTDIPVSTSSSSSSSMNTTASDHSKSDAKMVVTNVSNSKSNLTLVSANSLVMAAAAARMAHHSSGDISSITAAAASIANGTGELITVIEQQKSENVGDLKLNGLRNDVGCELDDCEKKNGERFGGIYRWYCGSCVSAHGPPGPKIDYDEEKRELFAPKKGSKIFDCETVRIGYVDGVPITKASRQHLTHLLSLPQKKRYWKVRVDICGPDYPIVSLRSQKRICATENLYPGDFVAIYDGRLYPTRSKKIGWWTKNRKVTNVEINNHSEFSIDAGI